MPSLADIASVPEIIDIRGLKFQVNGLSASHIAKLLEAFPPLRAMMTNREVAPEEWFKKLPEIVPIIIAAGCGKDDDPAEIEAASRLGIEDQMALLAPIWKKTMPSGLTPFLERLTVLAGMPATPAAAIASAPAASSKAPVTKSPRQSKR